MLDHVGLQDFFCREGANPRVRERGGSHGHAFCRELNGATLEIKFQGFNQIGALRKGFIFTQEIPDGEIAIGRFFLGEIHGIVKADVLPTAECLPLREYVIEAFRGGEGLLHHATDADRPGI